MGRYNSMYTRKQATQLSYDASTVWGAACTAQRINGAYVKHLEMDENYKPKFPNQKINRDIMKEAIADPSMITDADRVAGEETRTYYKGLTFKILRGKKLSDFDNSAMVIANRDTITSMYDVAVIAALPSCFDRGRARDKMDYRVQATNGFIGKVGDKIEVEIEVAKSIFSNNYGIYFITGITPTNESVFFAQKEGLTAGDKVKIKGTVKAHRDTSTQLNRVKVIS